MGLQDMQAGGIINACKMCGQVAIVWLQHHVSPVDHSRGTTTVPGDPTG
jgi:hypothetical protein